MIMNLDIYIYSSSYSYIVIFTFIFVHIYIYGYINKLMRMRMLIYIDHINSVAQGFEPDREEFNFLQLARARCVHWYCN